MTLQGTAGTTNVVLTKEENKSNKFLQGNIAYLVISLKCIEKNSAKHLFHSNQNLESYDNLRKCSINPVDTGRKLIVRT